MSLLIRNTSLVVIACLFINSSLYGAINPPLIPEDYGYYFVFNKEIRDVRNFSVVNTTIAATPEHSIWRSDDNQHLYSGSNKTRSYTRYSLFGQAGHTFNLTNDRTAMIGPGWQYKIYIKENDLWAADLDWDSGQEKNHRQVTQLGIFNAQYGIGYTHWYKDRIILHIDFKCYILNITTGELGGMIPDDSYCATDLYWVASPDNRYLFYKGMIIDMEAMETYPSPLWAGGDFYWQNNHTLFGYGYLGPGDVLGTGHRAHIFDLSTRDWVETFRPEFLRMLWNQKHGRGKVTHCFSPSRRYLLYIENTPPTVKIGDTENHLIIDTDISVPKNIEQDFRFRWTSDGSLIYSVKGDLLTQGTWCYDIHTRTQKKISSYIAMTMVVLPKANAIVFNANNHLYRVDLDGTNLKQLTTEPLKPWSQHLAGFVE